VLAIVPSHADVSSARRNEQLRCIERVGRAQAARPGRVELADAVMLERAVSLYVEARKRVIRFIEFLLETARRFCRRERLLRHLGIGVMAYFFERRKRNLYLHCGRKHAPGRFFRPSCRWPARDRATRNLRIPSQLDQKRYASPCRAFELSVVPLTIARG